MADITPCPDCGELFNTIPTSGRGAHHVRCVGCRPEHVRQLSRAGAAMRRAKASGSSYVELVMLRDVFIRDNWTCYLCGDVIPVESRDRTGSHTGKYDPLAPTADHIIPATAGGPHTMSNLKTAHNTCNRRKHVGATMPDRKPRDRRNPRPQATADKGNECVVDGCTRPQGYYKRGRCNSHHQRVKTTGDPLKALCQCGCKSLIAVDATHFGAIFVDGHGTGQRRAASLEDQLATRYCLQPVTEHGRSIGLTDDCHIWTGPKHVNGYGAVSVRSAHDKSRTQMAHRAVYQQVHGDVTGKVVDHLCRERLCINVNHLEAVDHAENLRRGAEVITACPKGHPYTERNMKGGVRVCRQCARNKGPNGHIARTGHEFVVDLTNPSIKRERCLVCREGRQAA